MKRTRIAPLGIALALAGVSTVASAQAYVTYRDVYASPAPAETVRIERVEYPRIATYEDRYVVTTVPATSYDNTRYVAAREATIVRAEPIVVTGAPLYATNEWNPRHPHWGHLIDRGLFNRTGPTDFGR